MLRIIFFLLLFSFSKNTVRAQISPIEKMEYELDSIIRIGIDSFAFPGAQILVRHRDSIIFHKTWGFHTYDNQRTVSKTDIYDLASITKVTSGLPILMKLYGEGKLNLDIGLKEYFKPLRRSNKKDLTLREVLTHQSGLIPYIVFWQKTKKKNGKYKGSTFKNRASRKYSVQISDDLYLNKRYVNKMKKAIRKTELNSDKKYLYSGLTFLLMPEMIHDKTGIQMTDFLHDSIYAPIGIKNLVYNPLSTYNLNQIVPTEYDSLWRNKLVHGTVHDEAAAMLDGVSCNAGLFGDAVDLSSLFQLYLNNGLWNGRQIIPANAMHEFTSYQYSENRRGLGFDKPAKVYDEDLSYVARDASPKSFGHSGFTGTMVWADPEYDLVFVFLSNRVYPNRSHRNLYRLSLRPKMHQVVYDYIKNLD